MISVKMYILILEGHGYKSGKVLNWYFCWPIHIFISSNEVDNFANISRFYLFL